MPNEELTLQSVSTEFMHLLNLPFLSKEREIEIENRCREAHWSEEYISLAKRQAAARSNWNKGSTIRNQLQREKLPVEPMNFIKRS